MAAMQGYLDREPSRAEVDAMPGETVLEFGAPWCGHCTGARPAIEQVLARHGAVRHLRIEDGPGRPLGRSFRIKLWPTLVRMRDGEEIARVVRPRAPADVDRLFDPGTDEAREG